MTLASRTKISPMVLPVALILALATAATAAERVAQLSKAEGKVTIARSGQDRVDEVTQAGPRLRNASLFPGDRVTTEPGAQATLVFTDGSEIRLKEKTSLSVEQVDLTALMKDGKQDKPVGRVIRLFAGDVWTHVVPNGTIATMYETPSGVAAVKGTTFTISVGGEGKP